MSEEFLEIVDMDGMPDAPPDAGPGSRPYAEQDAAGLQPGSAPLPERPHRRRRRRRRSRWPLILVLIAAVLAAVYFLLPGLRAGRAPASVTTWTADRADLTQIVSLSGTVVTGESRSYFAEVSVPVASLPYSAGDAVKAGDVLVTFDSAKLELARSQAILTQNAAEGDYSSSMTRSAEGTADRAEADARIAELDVQIKIMQDAIDSLNQQIADRQSWIAQTGRDLQKTMIELKPEDNDYAERRDALQKAIQDNSYEQANDLQISSWRVNITDMQQVLNDLQTEKSKMDAQRTSGEAAELNAGARQALEANREQTERTSQDTLQSISAAEAGFTAGFNGIVTDVKVVEGMTPQKGQELLTIASTDDVKVQVQVTKNDLDKLREGQTAHVTIAGYEYSGTVTKIAGSAVRNANNVPVVSAEITLARPDSHVILGIEANCDIETKTAKDTVVLPYEYVNTDTKGDFVWMVRDGVIRRQPVSIGITTDTLIEIERGVEAGDQVTDSLPAGLEEGSAVTAAPAAPQQENN